MKIFVDTANLDDIEEALKRGFARGVTTNPSLFAKEPKADFEAHVQKIVLLIQKYQPDAHLSVEVFSTESEKIIEQAGHFKETFALKNLSIKVPIGWNELEVIKKLSSAGISVNCTCNMSVSQAVMAAAAGAKYVSLFWARIRDAGVKSDDSHRSNREKMLEENWKKAAFLLTEALKNSQPPILEPYLWLAESFEKSGEKEKALAVYDLTLSLYPLSIDALQGIKRLEQ